MTNDNNRSPKNMKPPKPCKFTSVDITFDEKDFPPLTDNRQPASNKQNTNSASSTATTTSQTSTITAPPTFDYKAELSCLSTEIKTTLKCQFDELLGQMETKLDNFITTSNACHDNQECFNENVMKQLGYLVDNMKKLLKIIPSALSTSNPLPRLGGGSA